MNNLLTRLPLTAVCAAAAVLTAGAQRDVQTLKTGWEFAHGGAEAAKANPDQAAAWQPVNVPHDWAIYGPFSRDNDLQVVAVEQNGESTPTVKTARTGGLPFIGKGSYRTTFNLADTAGVSTTLVFDGAMSNATVKVNGREAIHWPYGYNSFYVQVDSLVAPGENLLEVDLENFEQASRWYPGAGLYRNVHVVTTPKVHIPTWGTRVTTPKVTPEFATVTVESEIVGLPKGGKAMVTTEILDADGRVVALSKQPYVAQGQTHIQNITLPQPTLWDTDRSYLYTARTSVQPLREAEWGKYGEPDTSVTPDVYDTRFGVRTLEYVPEKGFFLNGRETKFKGVCNHHDLGPLGAAVNRSALRHQLELLRDMGANAVRTSHNMPAPELVELCDEMGIMLMLEPFDDWGFRPKSPNGYGRFFPEWAERDVTNMVRHYRNSPSVVMWSIGNEVPSQWGPDGVQELTMLRDLVHDLDDTRPVTCGMDQIGAVLGNGFAAALDIPGFNYKPQFYTQAKEILPQGLILGSETASTVSSRGVYHFPVPEFEDHYTVVHPDGQSNSYDNEACSWSNTPDIDFAMEDDYPWMLGQFVWTGFDYLGEPSPYDTDAWPNHSSVFGIIDLASLPKDRFYLYRSKWNTDSATLHVLPHWNWKGREGQVTPVYVYTSYPAAELFINGKSQGRREKNDSTLQNRYRLMWNETVYTPGELRVVAYDASGHPAAEKTIRTAGKPHHMAVCPNRTEVDANGEELVYFTVTVEDKDGNPVPTDSRAVRFDVTGAGTFEATANGDPRSLRSFQKPEMDLFSGAATAIARASSTPGTLTLRASAPGVKPAQASVTVK